MLVGGVLHPHQPLERIAVHAAAAGRAGGRSRCKSAASSSAGRVSFKARELVARPAHQCPQAVAGPAPHTAAENHSSAMASPAVPFTPVLPVEGGGDVELDAQHGAGDGVQVRLHLRWGRWKAEAQGVTNLWGTLRVMGCRSAVGRKTVKEGRSWVMCRGRCRVMVRTYILNYLFEHAG